jgi:hypothetical protein
LKNKLTIKLFKYNLIKTAESTSGTKRLDLKEELKPFFGLQQRNFKNLKGIERLVSGS